MFLPVVSNQGPLLTQTPYLWLKADGSDSVDNTFSINLNLKRHSMCVLVRTLPWENQTTATRNIPPSAAEWWITLVKFLQAIIARLWGKYDSCRFLDSLKIEQNSKRQKGQMMKSEKRQAKMHNGTAGMPEKLSPLKEQH